ncbi:MAG: cytochrome c [Bacteroidota bacterium]
MNQQKYLVKALLILMLISGGFFIAKKIFFSERKQNDSISVNEVVTTYQKQDSSVIEGKKLFVACEPCHSIFKDATGPALAGVSDRWPDKKELFEFIQNPALVMTRNSYARKLKEKFGSMTPAFPGLSNRQIQSILNYIKSREKPVP